MSNNMIPSRNDLLTTETFDSFMQNGGNNTNTFSIPSRNKFLETETFDNFNQNGGNKTNTFILSRNDLIATETFDSFMQHGGKNNIVKGFRSVNNSSLLSSTIKNTQLLITGTKNYNVSGEDYIFLRINDWGNFDFFNQILFSKIFLRSDLTTTNKTNNFINKEHVFSQLKTINKLDIELIDYLGNTVDLNGIDFSFTLSFRTQTNIGQKQIFELQNKGF